MCAMQLQFDWHRRRHSANIPVNSACKRIQSKSHSPLCWFKCVIIHDWCIQICRLVYMRCQQKSPLLFLYLSGRMLWSLPISHTFPQSCHYRPTKYYNRCTFHSFFSSRNCCQVWGCQVWGGKVSTASDEFYRPQYCSKYTRVDWSVFNSTRRIINSVDLFV